MNQKILRNSAPPPFWRVLVIVLVPLALMKLVGLVVMHVLDGMPYPGIVASIYHERNTHLASAMECLVGLGLLVGFALAFWVSRWPRKARVESTHSA